MATIKIRRGSGQPAIGGSGLTAYEPAWDTVNNRFFINNGSTAMWIGAAVVQDTTLSGNCAWTIPTQQSVKTYVDNSVSAGAVSSVNGVTGAMTIGGGTAISIATSTSARGITITNTGVWSINGGTGPITNIAVTNAAQSFTGLQSFLSGISSAGATISTGLYTNSTTLNLFNETAQTINFAGAGKNIIIANGSTASTLTIGSNLISFNNNVSVDGIKFDTDGQQLVFAPNPAAIGGGSTPTLTVEALDGGNGLVKVDGGHLYLGRVTNASSLVSAAGIIFEGAIDNTSETFLTVAKASTDRTITLPDDTGTVALTKNIVSSVNGLTGAVTDVASLNSATGAVSLFAGAGLSVASSTSIRGITFTNIGVVGITGTVNQVSVSGTSGSVTLSLPSTIVAPGSLAVTGLLNPTAGISANGGMTLAGSLQAAAATFSGLVTASSGLVVTGGVTFNSNITAPNLVTSVNGLTGAITDVASLNGATGAVTVGAGTGISIATSTAARGITVTNVGVTGLTGTANQITVSGTTGSITLTLPSAITAPGSLATTTTLSVGTDLTVSGNLTVNGTTTTVNSTTVTVQDPIIAIGGITGNAPPPNGDTKDRGIVFQWNNGSTGRTGFFGFDRSTQRFSYFPSGVTLSGEIITPLPAAGSAEFAGVYAPQGFLTLEGTCAASATISLSGGTGVNSTLLTYSGKRHIFANGSLAGDDPQIELYSAGLQSPNVATIITSTAGSLTNSNKTLTLPDWSGGAIVAATSGATSGFILRGIGATSRPDWFNPNTSGFTAFTSTNVNLVGVKDSLNYGLVFALGTAGNNILYGDSTTGVRWQPSTNTLTVGAGLGYLEGIVDGGAF